MSYPHTASPSRRRLLAGGGALGLGSLLSACGQRHTPSSGHGSGSWSFTDARGKKVTAAGTPQRIVAFTGSAAALWDFGLREQIVGVFGETRGPHGHPDPQAGDLDLAQVTIIGNTYGEFDIEKYAGLRPELLVTHMYDRGALWYVPAESTDKISKLAPSVTISTARVPLPEPIERYASLAHSLGADLSAAPTVAAKKRFHAAADTLRASARAKPRLKVMAASGSPDLFYISNPQINTDLRYFGELGVDLVLPDKPDKGGYYESLSWENADKYHADLILLDARSTALQPEDLASKPTWRRLPAVKAGQVATWDAVPRFSYAGAAPLLEALASSISNSRHLA